MHPLYSLEHVDPRAFDLLAWYNLVGAAGCLSWVVAYVLMIKVGFRDRAPGLPMVAIALNFSWEILASFAFPNPVWLWHTFDRVWMLVDVLIVYQLLRFGRPFIRIPQFREHFYPLVTVVFLTGLIGQWSFVADYPDRLGLVVAFMINLIMSIAFVFMYYERKDHRRGLSLGGAWAKMLGTLGTSIECHYVVRMVDPELHGLHFLTFLSVSIFLVDCGYIWLLSRSPVVHRAV